MASPTQWTWIWVVIANENFISLITNVGWESIYHYFEGVDGSKAGALKDKARRLLKG